MGLLLYSVTGHRWCSIAVSIASAYPGMIGPLRDIWGPFMNIRGMRPGNLYLALSLFLFIPFFSRLTNGNVKNRSSLLYWGSLGLAFGLLTNIHQVSALGVISISLSLIHI